MTDQLSINQLREAAEEQVETPSLDEIERLSPSEIKHMMHDLWVHQVELEMQNDELRKTQAVLSSSRDKYARLYDDAPVGYCSLDEHGLITECNRTLSNILGLGRGKLINYPLGQFVHPQDLHILHHILQSDVRNIEHGLRFVSDEKDKTKHLMLHFQHISDDVDNSTASWFVALTDITEQTETTRELMIKGQALDNILEGVMITDPQLRLCYVNKAFELTTGYSRHQAIGRSPSMLKSDKQGKTFYADMWARLNDKGNWQGEIWNRRANGEIYPEWLSINTIRDEQHRLQYYVGVFSDISREENTRRRLNQLAYFDGITELPNRHLFMDRLKQELAHSRRYKTGFALLFMDLDRFKTINDTLGHSTGDKLLVQVGHRLNCALRENDTIARMGGDEFLMLLPGVDSQHDAEQVAEKILELMAQPFDLGGRVFHISISVGLSRYPDDGLDAETLIKHADIAMYRSKDSGRNTYRSFNQDLNRQVSERIFLENDLRDALLNDHLELHYQPQWDLNNDCLFGVEALLRWHHPRLGNIPPGQFIPLAEESGMINDIGIWVLKKAAAQYLRWTREGIEPGLVSVNLSPQQFMQSNLVDTITRVLEDSGMPARKLAVEITEHAAMPNFQYSVKTLDALRSMGIAIHIDDFGTGFSSLSHLRHLPIDMLKIDQQFIDEIPDNRDDLAIVKAILALSKTLNISVVAEGVETGIQKQFLIDNGCEVAQGYLIARPMPVSELTALLMQNKLATP